MLVHDTKIAVMLLLDMGPLFEGANVIADVQAMGRLYPRKNDILHKIDEMGISYQAWLKASNLLIRMLRPLTIRVKSTARTSKKKG